MPNEPSEDSPFVRPDNTEPGDPSSDNSSVNLVSKTVTAEGQQSIAIGEASNTVVNTGTVHGGITNITVNEKSGRSTFTRDNIDSALSLIKLNQSLSSDLSRRIGRELEDAREAFREGKTAQGFQTVRAITQSINWPALEGSLRAMVLRALANMVLSLRGKAGIGEAEESINEAFQLDSECDVHTVKVRIKLLREGLPTGLNDLANPTSLDDFNLRVGVLIETGEIEEALRSLKSPPQQISIDAESYRLQALACLISRDLEGARNAKDEALKRMPKRQNIRIAAALVDYYLSVSPLALQADAILYPYPLNPALVKLDDESQQRLRRSATSFAEIAQEFEESSNAQRETDTWQIACVASISDAAAEAIELCRAALAKDPTHFRILAWVLQRRYAIDLTPSEQALNKLLATNAINHEDRLHYALSLLGIYLNKRATDAILKLIERERGLFETVGRLDLWRSWRGQALIDREEPVKALQQANEIEDVKLRAMLKVLALCEIGNVNRDWSQLIEYLETEWENTKDPQFLVHLCEIKAQMGDWPYVADRAEDYCENVRTASSAYLAITAARYANRNQLCLRFLEKYKELFPGGKLPEDLRRLQAFCKLESQDVPSALAEIERLVAENDSVENILSLIDVLLATGDLSGVETAARRLRKRELTPIQCLKLADVVRIEDVELAKEFWRRAKDEAQADKSLALFAVMLAFKLGLDREVGSLWRPIDEIARSDDERLQLLDMEQLFSRMREHQIGLENINTLYSSGEAPIALVAERVKRPMIDIFSGLADENRSTLPSQWNSRPRVFVRHGARLLPPPENFERSASWHLHVDLTSLILADRLGLLDKIEHTFRPLTISGKVPTALLQQRSELLEIQQTQLENCRTILRLVDEGKLRSLDTASFDNHVATLQNILKEAAPSEELKDRPGDVSFENATSGNLKTQLGVNRINMLAAAANRDGFAVGLLPLRAYGNTKLRILELPTLLRNRIVNCAAIVESLRSADRISEQVFQRARDGLGQEGNPNISPASPLLNSELYLMQGVADVLAGAGVLERACDHFDVFIGDDSVMDARETIKEHERRQIVATTAEKLVHRINAGLQDGTYKFVTISDERLNETADVDEPENPSLAATTDLLRCQPTEWDIFLIDDRAINKYPFIDRAPIIGISEILFALRQREAIDKDEYYEALLRLRAENFRYVPIDDEEIAYHLRRSPVKNGTVVESQGLSILRRYLASCLLDTDSLQPNVTSNGDRNRFGENDFVTNYQIAVNAAISDCWEDETINDETARAHADWVLDNLYVGLFGTLHVQARNVTGVLPSRLQARDLAGLLMSALKIGDPLHPERRSKKRTAYFQWLAARVTDPRFRSDSKMLVAAAREIERMFTLFSKRGREAAQGAVVERILLQRLFVDLPDEVRDEIDLDNETREWLGVTTFSAAEVGGRTFDVTEFVLAVESALAGKATTIRTQDSKEELRFRIVAAESDGDAIDIGPAVAAFDHNNEEIAVLGDPMLKVLAPDLEIRERAVRAFRNWFDGSDEEFEAEVKLIARTNNPHERLDRVKRIEVESSEAFYRHIEYRLRQRQLRSHELIPHFLKILLNRFKLPTTFEGDFNKIWGQSAKALIADLGLERAIERCACLPVKMPSSVLKAFSKTSSDERRSLIQKLESRSASPVTRLHVLNLLLRVADETEIAEVKKMVSALYDNAAAGDFSAFNAVLLFVHGELERSHDLSEVSPQIRLALTWAHASTIHNIFHSVGFPSADIVDMFRRHTEQRAAEAILKESESWDDCLHPHRISRTAFLTHGLAKMFDGMNADRIKEAGIIPLMEEKIVRDINGMKIPDIPLLQDSTLLKDGLGSIFGGDHAQSLSILEDEAVELLSSEKLKEIVEQSLDQILLDGNDSGWLSIMFVLGDLAIYPDLQEKIRSAMMNIQIEAFIANQGVARAALTTAANQVRHWGDEELRLATKEKILAAMKLEIERSIEREGSSENRKHAEDRGTIDLVDAALTCSLVRGDPMRTGRNLASTLDDISQIWPSVSKRFGATICAFVWELPVEVTISWWPLLLKFRATMNQPI